MERKGKNVLVIKKKSLFLSNTNCEYYGESGRNTNAFEARRRTGTENVVSVFLQAAGDVCVEISAAT